MNKTNTQDKGKGEQIDQMNQDDSKSNFMNFLQETEEDEEEVKDDDDFVEVREDILEKMEKRGFDCYYLRGCLERNEHTYGTTGYHLLDEDACIYQDARPSNIQF